MDTVQVDCVVCETTVPITEAKYVPFSHRYVCGEDCYIEMLDRQYNSTTFHMEQGGGPMNLDD